MKCFIVFFTILNNIVDVFAAPTTVGEVTIKVIEDIVEGEQELTNDIFQDFDKVDCLFYQKQNSIGECKPMEWGTLMIHVINIVIISIIINFIYKICNKCCCICKSKKDDQDLEQITLEDYEKLQEEFLQMKKKRSEVEDSNLRLIQIINEFKKS